MRKQGLFSHIFKRHLCVVTRDFFTSSFVIPNSVTRPVYSKLPSLHHYSSYSMFYSKLQNDPFCIVLVGRRYWVGTLIWDHSSKEGRKLIRNIRVVKITTNNQTIEKVFQISENLMSLMRKMMNINTVQLPDTSI